MKRVLVISAHPDDMEIGMGGTAAKLVEAGAAVTSVVLTDGGRGPNPFSLSRKKLVEVRMKEALESAAVLGVKQVIFLELPDLRSEDNFLTAKKRLKALLAQIGPSEVYTLHEVLDRHPTHRLAGRVTSESVREADISPSPTVWAYEAWGLFSSWDRLEFIDGHIGAKLLAIGKHRSQTASIPFGEGVVGLNRWRAAFADPRQTEAEGVFAEAFVSMSRKAAE